MAHSKFIVIKCPACGEKFEAERGEEASFVSCPACDMQMKISGTQERRSRGPRSVAPATSLPARRQREHVQFSDLASTSEKWGASPKRRRPEAEDLRLEGEEAAAEDRGEADPEKNGTRSAMERRAARLEERAAKLEEKARQARLQAEREAQAARSGSSSEGDDHGVGDDDLEDLGDLDQEGSSKGSPPPVVAGAKDGEDVQGDAPTGGDQGEDPAAPSFEKVEVRSSGERRRLRQAPKAEVPQPKGRRGQALVVSDLVREKARAEKEPLAVRPAQDFAGRKVTEGSRWRRHQPNRAEEPEWESSERHRSRRSVSHGSSRIWWVTGVIALLILLVGGAYPFIKDRFNQPPSLETADSQEAGPTKQIRLTKGEMVAQATPVIEAFLQSASNQEALKYVRQPEKVAAYMDRFYLADGFRPVSYKSLGMAEEAQEIDGGFLRLPVIFEDFTVRDIYVEVPDGGEGGQEYRVDWESWEGYSEMSFPELRLHRPTEPVLIRCILRHNHHNGTAFQDGENYRSFEIANDQLERQFWGFMQTTGSALTTVKALQVGTDHDGGHFRATIKIRFPEASTALNSTDEVEITEFVTDGWVIKE